jgi:ABC-type multidrug transport system fused ATPase/permease subunit
MSAPLERVVDRDGCRGVSGQSPLREREEHVPIEQKGAGQISLEASQRQPGLDRATLGSKAWRKRIAAAPQFHENHLFSDTLAFNLLLGRRWPPTADDLRWAEVVCRRLDLGDLIDRMPTGLFQPVGETGWQLSHGERSRVFMARALLQGADMVVLDESFAELDPESLQRCLPEAAELSKTCSWLRMPDSKSLVVSR